VFNVVDDFSRECVMQIVDFAISGQRLVRELDRLAEKRPLPRRIVLDNELPAVSMELVAIRDRSGITRLPSNNVMLG